MIKVDYLSRFTKCILPPVHFSLDTEVRVQLYLSLFLYMQCSMIGEMRLFHTLSDFPRWPKNISPTSSYEAENLTLCSLLLCSLVCGRLFIPQRSEAAMTFFS